MKENKENSVELTIPRKIGVFEDKKTKVKTIALPFKFLDGHNGIISITKIVKYDWKPQEDIKAIKLIFAD